MSIGSLYTLGQVRDITGEDRNLITFLLRDRQIPTLKIGMAKVLDDRGLDMLREAIAEYRAKPEPATAS